MKEERLKTGDLIQVVDVNLRNELKLRDNIKPENALLVVSITEVEMNYRYREPKLYDVEVTDGKVKAIICMLEEDVGKEVIKINKD